MVVCKCVNRTVFHRRNMAIIDSIIKGTVVSEPYSPSTKQSHAQKLDLFFKRNPYFSSIYKNIPSKLLLLKRATPADNLYLIDDRVAEVACDLIWPHVQHEDHVIAETNAGFGFISKLLLEKGANLVRFYEADKDFRTLLKQSFEPYQGRFEMFTKDIFLSHRYEYLDKQDNENRIQTLMQGVPVKLWSDEPVLTIIGTMPNTNFIRFLTKGFSLQKSVTSKGRIQIFAFMRPKDYVTLGAGPQCNLHTYQRWSVFFHLFFEFELLEKFPRLVFLPWESPKIPKLRRYASTIDTDKLYFVRISFKKNIPIEPEHLLPFYGFITRFFSRGSKPVIPALEKWIPGCGLKILMPDIKSDDHFKDMNIFTKFGELKPHQMLHIFHEIIQLPEYNNANFVDMIETELIRTETTETDLHDQLEKNIDEEQCE